MTSRNQQRLKQICDYADRYGIEKAAKDYNVSQETITRYQRAARQHDRGPDIIPNILLLDIETLPMWVRVWGLYKQRIPHDNVIKDWIILSWSAKWLMDSVIHSDILKPKEIAERDDSRVCRTIWSLMDKADIIIAHNAKRFDIRKLNSRFMIHDMKPPSPYEVIDTLEQSRKIAAHSSHRLDWLGVLIRNEGKIHTDYSLWLRCENGDRAALEEMIKYNKEDVGLLEEVYIWMRPWIKSHPNVGLLLDLDESVCPNCGSSNIREEGTYHTPANQYIAIRCECGAIGRLRSSNLSRTQSAKLVRSAAR